MLSSGLDPTELLEAVDTGDALFGVGCVTTQNLKLG